MLMLGCRPSAQPLLPADLKSALLVGPDRKIEAIEGDQKVQVFLTADGGSLLLFGFCSGLVDLFLQPGHLDVPVPPAGRPLPLADWYLELDSEDQVPVWSEAPRARDETTSFRLATVSAEACASAGGCFPSEANRGLGDCRRSCNPVSPPEPEPPEPPLPPTFANCPMEWTSLDGVCSAPAHVGSCLSGQWQTFAAPGCEPIEECPAGSFRGVADVYVDSQATGLQDGTELHPYRTLADAILGGGSRVVAMAPGTYEAQQIPPGTVLVGHCALTTTLLGPFATSGPVRLSHLRIEGIGSGTAVEVVDGTLGLTNVDATFSGADPGVCVHGGARFEAEASQIRSVGVGIHAVGAQVDLSGVVLEFAGAVGIDAEDSGLFLARVRARSAAAFVRARRSRLEMDIAVVDTQGVGLAVVEGSTASLSHLELRAGDIGVDVIESSVEIATSRVVGARSRGLSVERGKLLVTDVSISDVLGDPSTARGVAANDSDVEIRRVHLSGINGSALSLSGTLVVEDLRAEDVDRSEGALLAITEGPVSRLQLRRALLTGGAGGLHVGDNAEAIIESLEVRDITGGVAPLQWTIYVGDGPRTELRQVRISESTVYGLWIYGREKARQVTDLKVVNAGTGVRLPTYSTAIDPGALSTATFSRVEVQGSKAIGFCVGRGWRVQVDDLKILSTGESVLADCVGDDRGGAGRVVGGTSEVFLKRFEIREAKVGVSLQALAVLGAADGQLTELKDALVAPGKTLSDFLLRIAYRNVDRTGP